MDDEYLPDEFVLDDTPEKDDAPKVIFAGPSDPPPVFRLSPSAAQTARRHPRYAIITLCLFAGTVILAVTESLHPPPVTFERPAISFTRVAPPAPAAAEVPAAGVAPAASVADDAEAAQDAKRLAQNELEKGHTQRAIEAGERAVALDPTDAEAWLILGAGYDQRRAYTEARRCFAACVRLANHGPRGECAALLR